MSLLTDMLEDFLLFVTVSVQQPHEITVSFVNTTGMQRHPVAHTCPSLIKLPTGYSLDREFRRQLNTVLNSCDSFVYLATEIIARQLIPRFPGPFEGIINSLLVYFILQELNSYKTSVV